MPRLPSLHSATLATIAVILVYQLMIPPVVGLADQGDYARLLGVFHLAPTVQKPEERFYAYLNRTYRKDTAFRIPEWESFSTQYIFVGGAVLLNKWISKDGLLDIRVLSLIEILAFLVACHLLLRATRPLLPGRWHILISLALIFIFCDVGYVSYFNSFFYEPASYIFLFAFLAFWLETINSGARDRGKFALCSGCLLLFLAAKPQNVTVGVILALYFWRFSRFLKPRWMAWTASLLILIMSLAVYQAMPKINKAATAFNVLFLHVLSQSSDPAAELRSVHIDPFYARYSGFSAFTPGSPFFDPAFRNEFAEHVNHFTIVAYYLRHPEQMLDYLRWVLPRSTSLRPENSGNFEKSAGYAPGARSHGFAAWSAFHGRHLGRVASALLIVLMLSVPVAAWIAVSLRTIEQRLLTECYAVVALSACAVFFTTVLGDAVDIVKHLELFNALTDICLVFATGATISWARGFSPRRPRGLVSDASASVDRPDARVMHTSSQIHR